MMSSRGKRQPRLAHGRLPDGRRPTLVHLTETLHEAAVNAADAMNWSLSELTRVAMTEYLIRHAQRWVAR